MNRTSQSSGLNSIRRACTRSDTKPPDRPRSDLWGEITFCQSPEISTILHGGKAMCRLPTPDSAVQPSRNRPSFLASRTATRVRLTNANEVTALHSATEALRTSRPGPPSSDIITLESGGKL